MKTDPGLHDEIAAGSDRWKEAFHSGLQAMQDRHDLWRDADPGHLAYVLMAAFQGGMLITQAARDIAPLRNALYGAIAPSSHTSRAAHPAVPSTAATIRARTTSASQQAWLPCAIRPGSDRPHGRRSSSSSAGQSGQHPQALADACPPAGPLSGEPGSAGAAPGRPG